MTLALWILLAYAVGAISFAYLIVRWRRGIDLRTVGSGNLGATNVARALGKKWAIAVYVLDLLKGLVPALVGAWAMAPEHELEPFMLRLILGVAAVVGHCLPVWHGLKGGKGVATASGMLLAFHWPTFVVAALAFALALVVTRMISAGSLLAAAALPLAWIGWQGMSAFGGQPAIALVLLTSLSAWVIWRHRANLGRILQGTEPRIGRKNG